MKNPPQFLPSLASLIPHYDTFIVDLWGVIHDGQERYPNVAETLTLLKQQGKQLLFLSNAPYRATRVARTLQHLGISADYYERIVTSGETFWQTLAAPEQYPFFTARGKHFFHIGDKADLAIMEGLDYTESKAIEKADFLLLLDYGAAEPSLSGIAPLLEKALRHALPMVCVNPDKKTVDLHGKVTYCSGIIAEKYRTMGGEVLYFGKPYAAVYEACLAHIPAGNRILAVGDGLETDIKGANNQNIPNVLITGGIMQKHTGMPDQPDYQQNCLALFAREHIQPDFVTGGFGITAPSGEQAPWVAIPKGQK